MTAAHARASSCSSLSGLLQAKAGKGKASSADVAGIPAVFQQMAGKIVDFPWDASTGLACYCSAALAHLGSGTVNHGQCSLGSTINFAPMQDNVTALPDQRAVMLQHCPSKHLHQLTLVCHGRGGLCLPCHRGRAP